MKRKSVRIPFRGFRRLAQNPGLMAPLSGALAARWGLLLGGRGIEPTQATLLRLRRQHKLSRGHLAALLGVSVVAVRSWEEGLRKPGRAARRLVWLLATMLDDTAPETLEQLATWNRFRRPEHDQSGEH